MTEFFPLPMVDLNPRPQRSPPHVKAEAMAAVSEKAEMETLPPGETYTIYNARDVLGALPFEFEQVVRRAARWTGVDEDYICRVVEHFERRMKRWWTRQRKGEKVDDSDSSTSEDPEIL